MNIETLPSLRIEGHDFAGIFDFCCEFQEVRTFGDFCKLYYIYFFDT